MNINTNSREEFIPETNGNSKKDKPIRFTLQFLTVEEQGEIEYFEYVTANKNKVRIKTNDNEIFKRAVVGIEGLTVDNNKDIKTPEEFLAIRGPKWVSEMVKEVVLHLKAAMEVDSKN